MTRANIDESTARPSPTTIREQAGCIAWRRVDGALECLVITSTTGQWIFPKGGIDPGATPPEAAACEAFEEAGVIGEVDPEPLGHFEYSKAGRPQRVTLFAMTCTKVLDAWPEAAHRSRAWLSFEAARTRLERNGDRRLLDAAQQRIERM